MLSEPTSPPPNQRQTPGASPLLQFQLCQNSLIRQVTEILHKRRNGLNYLGLSTASPDSLPTSYHGGSKEGGGPKKALLEQTLRCHFPFTPHADQKVNPLACPRLPLDPGSTLIDGKDTLHVRHDLTGSPGGRRGEKPVTRRTEAGEPTSGGSLERATGSGCSRFRGFRAHFLFRFGTRGPGTTPKWLQ